MLLRQFPLLNLLVFSSLLYILVRLNISDKKLRMENGSDFAIPKHTILDRKTERALRKEGKLIKKITTVDDFLLFFLEGYPYNIS